MSINLRITEDRERIERDWTAWWTSEPGSPIMVLKTVDLLVNNFADRG